ncbi:hypothetical protein SAMN02745146_1137 [Hymenobacter daecheongensis DSM 21074]|uniref:Uncharacterized protein n=1 Tax=Hymenobacter daecheongensis DSM 21074 TaxID=1121955 RepID=A0A1M6CG68_9BACT|nr:hypothetical protein [Hymenobacter daecheongensis]SHI59744.1 hypothetical protein SAMN02745146_1137 [Hymenobacter daecheongensis DSM 21074]
MSITRTTVADKLLAYLRHQLTLSELVAWSEAAIMDGDLTEGDEPLLMEVLTKLGVADVRAFGLTWEDCEQMMRQFGYTLRIEASHAA